MKRNYQGYSGSSQNNQNPPSSISYPPLPSAPPPPQPAPSSASQSSQINHQFQQQQQQQQPSSSSINQSQSSQSYQYNPQQFASPSPAPYGQYPGYPPHQQPNPYPAPVSAPAPTATTPYGYNPQLPQNPQQQQPPQPPQQQQQHPAYPNYGYGQPAGPQQPSKLAQSYQSYPHASNQTHLPSNPPNQFSNPLNPNIPPNPYTAYTPAQVNAPTLQSSPGSAAPPPYKRPRYENTPGGAAYGPPTPQQAPYPSTTPQPTHQPPPPALPPLRNNNPLNPSSAGTIRIGSNTNNSRGAFNPSTRPPRPSTGPFGNNSPIRLNLASSAGVGSYDSATPAHYDSAHLHNPQPMAHPLPPHHQSPHPNSAMAHYPQNNSSFNSAPNNLNPANPADHHYPSHPPAHHNSNYPSSNDLNNSSLNPHQRAPNDGAMRPNNFAHNDYGPGYGSGPPSNHNEHYGFHDDSRPPHMATGSRSNRGGYRGGGSGGVSTPAGRMSRERGSDYGGDGMAARGGRGFGGHSYGGSGRGERHGSGTRGRGASGGANSRYDDHGSNYSSSGPSRHADRSGPASNRGSRNASNLPPLATGLHKPGHHHDRRGGPGGNPRYSGSTGGGMGERIGSGRGGRRMNGRDSKFDDHKNPHRPGRGGASSLSGAGGDRGERGRHGLGVGGNRVKNGWGSGFKEFNERELKEKEKGEEAPTKRTLTDFRINALEIADISWQWIADNPDGLIDMTSSGIGTLTTAGDEASKSAAVPLEPSVNRTGKHGRDEDEGRAEGGVEPMEALESTVNVPSTSVGGSKKVKSDVTVELAKKIDEEAASAVKGLNLTVDDQSSEHEESRVDDEVKNQLLSIQPAPAGVPQPDAPPDRVQDGASLTLAGEGDGQETNVKTLETQTSQESAKENPPSSASATPRAPTAAPEPPIVATPTHRERAPVAYAKPAIPSGRENSRLRLYFSSPATDPAVVTNLVGLPTKPLASGTGAKRKLSVSGHSAMSVDTKIGGGRGSSPVSSLSPVKGLVANKNVTKSVKPNSSEAKKAGPSEGPSKEQAKVVEPAVTAMATTAPTITTTMTTTTSEPGTTETEGVAQESAGKEKTGTEAEEDQVIVQTDVKTVQEDMTTKTSGEEAVEGAAVSEDRNPAQGYDEDADADGDYEVDESNQGSSSLYEEAPVPEPQADRLSISYARNTRRIVIDADVVKTLRVFRGEHKVEVLVKLLPALIQGGKYDGETDEYRVCKGILVEALDQEIDDYVIIDRATLEATWKMEQKAKGKAKVSAEPGVEGSGGKTNGLGTGMEDESEYDDGCVHDPLLPPLHRLLELCLQETSEPAEGADKTFEVKPGGGRFKQEQLLIVARLDRVNPLTEAKWVRTGDVDSWISQMTGRIFKPDEEHSDCGWRRKISVVDPDPAPTIQHLLDTWLTTSGVGSIETRQRFIDRHVAKNVDVIIEILLRVIRSSTSSSTSSHSSQSSLSHHHHHHQQQHHHHHPMPLIVQQAATLHAPYPEQQTQISLAVLGMYRLAIETAIEGGLGVEKVIKKATDIVRSLPYRLAFGALDGIYKDEVAAAAAAAATATATAALATSANNNNNNTGGGGSVVGGGGSGGG